MENVNSRCYCWFRAPILVHQNGAPRWRPHTKLYKGEWNVSANNSETEGHKDLTLGQIVYKLVFYNISFSWFLPVDGFQVTFWLRDSENDLFLVFWPAFIKQSFLSYLFSCQRWGITSEFIKTYTCLKISNSSLLKQNFDKRHKDKDKDNLLNDRYTGGGLPIPRATGSW